MGQLRHLPQFRHDANTRTAGLLGPCVGSSISGCCCTKSNARASPLALAEYKAVRARPTQQSQKRFQRSQTNVGSYQGNVGRLRHFLRQFQTNYGFGSGPPQSESCTPTVDTASASTVQDYSLTREPTTKCQAPLKRYMSQTPELEMNSGFGSHKYSGDHAVDRNNITRSSSQSQSHSFYHVPHVSVLPPEPRLTLPPTNRSLSTIRNLRPIQEYYSYESNEPQQQTKPVVEEHKPREDIRAIFTTRRPCGPSALRRSIISLHLNHNVDSVNQLKEESEPSKFPTEGRRRALTLVASSVPAAAEAPITARGMAQPSARREPSRRASILHRCRPAVRGRGTPGAVSSPVSGSVSVLPTLSIQRICANAPDAALRVKRRMGNSKIEENEVRNGKSPQEKKKQLSVTNLFRSQSKEDSKPNRHRPSLNRTACEGNGGTEKRRAKSKFGGETIYEAAAEEDQADVGKISARCHMTRDEPVVLVPALRTEGGSLLATCVAVCPALFLIFEPELEVFSSLSCIKNLSS